MKQSRHIAIVLDEFWPMPGGIATHYHHLCALLADAGQRVTLILDHAPGIPLSDARIQVINLETQVRTQLQTLRLLAGDEIETARRQIAFGRSAAEWLRQNWRAQSIDVVETMDTKGFGACLIDDDLPPVAAMAHGPMACEAVNLRLKITRDLRLQTSLELLLFSLADSVGAPSQAYATDWTAILERNVRFAPPPWRSAELPAETSAPADARHGPPWKAVVVGRLELRKGPVETAAACRLLRERGLDCTVRWLGHSSDTAPEGRDMAEYLQAQFPDIWATHFLHLGVQPRDRVRAEMAAADFVLVPSLRESFNYTTLEALDLARPVIVSTGAGVSAAIHDGQNGLLIPPGEPAALADAIARLAANPVLRKELGERGRNSLAAEYSPERVLGARFELYDSAIARRQVRNKMLCSLAPARTVLNELLSAIELSTYTNVEAMSFSKLARRALGKLKRQFLHN